MSWKSMEEIIAHAIKYEFEGLFVPGECGCLISDNLPCGIDACEVDCEFGFVNLCDGCGEYDSCDIRNGGDYCISRVRKNRVSDDG